MTWRIRDFEILVETISGTPMTLKLKPGQGVARADWDQVVNTVIAWASENNAAHISISKEPSVTISADLPESEFLAFEEGLRSALQTRLA